MQLTEDERAALGIHRARREAYPDHDDPTNRFRLQTDETVTLADMALRLFPVRTYGDLVIRWDDEITPERLVACGWIEGFRQKTGKYHLSVELHLDTPVGRMCFSYTQSQDRGKPYTWIAFHHYYSEDSLPEYLKPRNMLEVWQLMERCGIEEGGK